MPRSGARVPILLLMAAIAGVPAAGAGRASSQQRESIYVAVSDDRGRPVTGLTAADFQIFVDDRKQEILSAARATDPVSAIVLTDRLGLVNNYTAIDLQRALSSFIARVRKDAPGSRFALTTFDGPVVRLLSFTSPPGEVDRQIGRLTTLAEDAALLDALTDACRQMSAAPTPRRVVFVIFAGYRSDGSTVQPEVVGAMLQAAGASLWAIEARVPGTPAYGLLNRDVVVDRGTAITGGRLDSVASAVGVDTMSSQMGALIGSQYVVTYGPATGNVNSQLKVQVARPGLRVFAPGWLTR